MGPESVCPRHEFSFSVLTLPTLPLPSPDILKEALTGSTRDPLSWILAIKSAAIWKWYFLFLFLLLRITHQPTFPPRSRHTHTHTHTHGAYLIDMHGFRLTMGKTERLQVFSQSIYRSQYCLSIRSKNYHTYVPRWHDWMLIFSFRSTSNAYPLMCFKYPKCAFIMCMYTYLCSKKSWLHT